MSKKATLYFDLHCKCGFKYIFYYKKDVVNFQKKTGLAIADGKALFVCIEGWTSVFWYLKYLQFQRPF